MNGYAPEYVHKLRINLLPSETGSTPNVRFFYVLESIVMRCFLMMMCRFGDIFLSRVNLYQENRGFFTVMVKFR